MSTADDLKHAYQLIKQENTPEAEAILIPILQADPENVDAWWLMAYAVDEPQEVREALNQVLTLDPNYAQAPRAREMLQKLDEEYPPESEDISSPATDEFEQVFGSSTESSSFVESEDQFDEALFEEFDEDDFAASSDDMMSSPFDDDFGGAFEAPEDELLGVDELFEEESAPAEATVVTFEVDEPVDEETRAALEEKAARRQGRGWRLFILLLFLVVVGAGIVALAMLVLTSNERAGDPGALEAVTVETQAVNDALIAANNDVQIANLGSGSQALVAKSDLGNTLFVRVCGQPGPAMPQKALEGMEIAVQQAPDIQGELDAVGVSVANCDSAEHDTYYRAVVPVEDAVRYIIGDFGQGDQALAQFQALWQKA